MFDVLVLAVHNDYMEKEMGVLTVRVWCVSRRVSIIRFVC